MPLLKLWNSIRGRSNHDTTPVKIPAVVTVPPQAAATPVKRVDTSTPPAASPKAAAAKPARQKLNLFGGGNPHASLCKLVRSIPAKTVVEINVEDGSRAIAVMETLIQNLPPAPVATPIENGEAVDGVQTPAAPAVRYIVIDQFEMAGGATTLKQFHKTLREAGARATVYPETIDRGLIRVANTIGPVDLILISLPVDQWQTPSIESLLKRISHATTVVLHRQGNDWTKHQSGLVVGVRRAA